MSDAAPLVNERVTYRDGQRLSARDLRDDVRRSRSLRRLHVRDLHETWGIAAGFDVQAAGPGTVAVGPGYALDGEARDLVLSAGIALPVPAVQGPQLFVLVATFLEDCAFAASAAGGAVCLGGPLREGRERPAFAWRTPDQFQPGAMVPLCSATIESGAIKGAIGTRVRRYARRLVRPYIAAGRTDAEKTAWQPWWNSGILDGYVQHVDTADAGFTAAPQYFAELVAVKPSAGHSTAEVISALASTHGHVKETSRTGFDFQAVVPEPFRRDFLDTWAISWVGVQPMGGCPPALNLARLITLTGRYFTLAP